MIIAPKTQEEVVQTIMEVFYQAKLKGIINFGGGTGPNESGGRSFSVYMRDANGKGVTFVIDSKDIKLEVDKY